MLYLFSGVARKLDMATCLQQLAATWALDLGTECVDIKRSAKQDQVPDSYLDRIRAKEFDAILLSPPCASFSRTTWANFRGPRPVRSYELPLEDLEKLIPVERDRAILGNIFADFSFEIAIPWSYLPGYGAARGPWCATHWPTRRGAPARLYVAVAAASRPAEKGAKDCGFSPS